MAIKSEFHVVQVGQLTIDELEHAVDVFKEKTSWAPHHASYERHSEVRTFYASRVDIGVAEMEFKYIVMGRQVLIFNGSMHFTTVEEVTPHEFPNICSLLNIRLIKKS